MSAKKKNPQVEAEKRRLYILGCAKFYAAVKIATAKLRAKQVAESF